MDSIHTGKSHDPWHGSGACQDTVLETFQETTVGEGRRTKPLVLTHKPLPAYIMKPFKRPTLVGTYSHRSLLQFHVIIDILHT